MVDVVNLGCTEYRVIGVLHQSFSALKILGFEVFWADEVAVRDS